MLPTSTSERFVSLDLLRGFAILGILIMNIQSFSMIGAAYLNPMAYGDLTGINKWVWIFSHLLADQKFLSIFSILFGAGIVLMTNRVESRDLRPAGLHYRRTFWLLVIGLIHAYMFWHGDILVPYALCAFVAFLFRKAKPRTILIVGLVVFSISSLIYIMGGLFISQWPREAYDGTMESWMPTAETIAKELAALRGGFAQQLAYRGPTSLMFQTFIFFMWTGWRAGGLMLVGMALYKWGVLTAQRSRRFYLILMSAGFGFGFPIVMWGVIKNFAAGWTMDYSMFLGSQFNYWGSFFAAMGYIGLVMLISKSITRRDHVPRLAAVGRMALTNYLIQTLICTFIFYGHGLGLVGAVERKYQIMIMFAIWVLQWILSPIWLKHFRFGPAEWLWRSLTYWKFQPMRVESDRVLS